MDDRMALLAALNRLELLAQLYVGNLYGTKYDSKLSEMIDSSNMLRRFVIENTEDTTEDESQS